MTAPLFPTVMLTEEVAAVMRIKPKTVWNALKAGTFLPRPFAERPYRWRGEDIAAWYRGELREAEAKLRSQRRRKVA